MKKNRIHTLIYRVIVILIMTSFASPLLGCRLWGVIAREGHTINQGSPTDRSCLMEELRELQKQGGTGDNPWPYNNYDGWGLVYYYDAINIIQPWQIFRSPAPAQTDTANFSAMMSELLSSRGYNRLAVGHVRRSSSGATDIADPHPFVFNLEGSSYSLAHNGGVSKTVLLDLLTENGEDPYWLNSNPPQTYGYGPWNEEGWDYVVDSELMFLWIMKNIDENEGNALSGLHLALQQLESVSPGGKKNILFSDGNRLYAYRSTSGTTPDLFYTTGEPPQGYGDTMLSHFSVMSTPPDTGIAGMLDWIPIQNHSLIILDGVSVQVIEDFPTQPHDMFNTPTVPENFTLINYPNPFNPSTTISYFLPSDIFVSCGIYDVRGQLQTELVNGMRSAGAHSLIWNAENYATGVYFIRLRAGSQTLTRKILYLK